MERVKPLRKKKLKERCVYTSEECSEDMKRKREKILRKILDEFDLEETMAKYRSMNVCEYRPAGNSLREYQFRSELNRMGTEVIRLKDKSWSKKFVKKLQGNFSSLLDQQEEALAEKERKRLYRLRMDGITTDTPDVEGRQKEIHQRQSVEVVMFTKPHSDVERVKQKVRLPLFHDDQSNKKGKKLVARLSQKTYNVPKNLPSFECLLEPPQDGSVLFESTDNLRLSRANESVAERKKKRLPYEVAQLYEEQTVAGLYALGELLIYIEPKPEKVEEESEDTPDY